MLLESTEKFRAESEEAAKEMIEGFRKDAAEKGYIIKKASYEYKTKKSKGEIIAEAYLVTIVQVFADFWSELE